MEVYLIFKLHKPLWICQIFRNWTQIVVCKFRIKSIKTIKICELLLFNCNSYFFIQGVVELVFWDIILPLLIFESTLWNSISSFSGFTDMVNCFSFVCIVLSGGLWLIKVLAISLLKSILITDFSHRFINSLNPY